MPSQPREVLKFESSVMPGKDALPSVVRAIETPLRKRLADHPLLVVPGFVGISTRGGPALLGERGSDLTALFTADVLGAASCLLVKDVEGIFERDPDLPGHPLRHVSSLSWSAARKIAGRVLQPKALAFARQRRLAFRVTSLRMSPGTLVGPDRASSPRAWPRQAQVGALQQAVSRAARPLWRPDRSPAAGLATWMTQPARARPSLIQSAFVPASPLPHARRSPFPLSLHRVHCPSRRSRCSWVRTEGDFPCRASS